MRRRTLCLLVALASPAAVTAVAPLGLAAAIAAPVASTATTRLASSAMAGFAFVDGPGPTSPATTYDSAGGTVSATENVSGFFAVTFGGLGFTGGDVQVSSINGQGSCVIEAWSPSGSDLSVDITCFDHGVPSDEPFDVLVTKPANAPTGVLDYALDSRKASSGPLHNGFSYNSAGKANSSAHVGTGRYLVTMSGPAAAGPNTGTVKITAFGKAAGDCQLGSWRGNSTGQQIGVDCFSGSGAPANREFTIAYARGNNLMGSNGKVDANALANGTQVVYQPTVQYDSTRLARVTVLHLGTGNYEVVEAGSVATHRSGGGDGDAQITASGGRYVTCGFFVPGTHEPTVDLSCYNAAGHLANTAFTIQWVVTS